MGLFQALIEARFGQVPASSGVARSGVVWSWLGTEIYS